MSFHLDTKLQKTIAKANFKNGDNFVYLQIMIGNKNKRQQRYENILRKAVELFAIQGYDNTTISDLQEELDMGRGTMYFHFKNKEDLLRKVMNHYFLDPKENILLNMSDNIEVPDMINSLLTYLDSLKEALETLEYKDIINTSNVMMLMYSAYSRFDDMARKAKRLYQVEYGLWKRAIENSIKKGDVRSDVPIEIVANMFTHLKDSYDPGLHSRKMDFSSFPIAYNCLFDMIKVKK